MLRRAILTNLSLFLTIGSPLIAFGANDSTKISISVVIGNTQQCDYAYSLENNNSINSKSYFQRSSCDQGIHKLQQHLEHISYSTNIIDNSHLNSKEYRVLMTVQ